MKKIVAKVFYIMAGIVMLAALFFIFSFDYRGLPQTPQPETGRIYPLSTGRGGLAGYVTHGEKLQYGVSLGILLVSILVAAVADYYFDPFGRRKWVKPLAGYRGEKDC
jgi:hypothetical protein